MLNQLFEKKREKNAANPGSEETENETRRAKKERRVRARDGAGTPSGVRLVIVTTQSHTDITSR